MSKKEQAQAAEEQIPTVDSEMSEETQDAEQAVSNDLNAMLQEAQKEVEAQKDLAIRTLADMENLKRRTRIDVENAHKFALEKFVNALIPVLDSMEMGLEASNKEEATLDTIREGLEMTLKQTLDVLGSFSVERLDPKGEKFNPQHHEAMTMVPSPEHESNTVMDVIQKGYVLNERLVRPARVIVAQ
ncbi:nucleotide exchange factor GrpE [Hydrogenovibrio kuenenii]|uniref:nucleotide exchange factor GrpE n=1 Tax=Hydrogenovibrio kuenenii TaxID=63658 RepID=UPI0004666ACF|nr:nucleotide exchange factor GrpE [Hydrogenovibrio kuenenii]